MKGKVIKIENGIATIELERSNACKGCGLCLSVKDSKTMVLEVKALAETKTGDFVSLKISRKMKASAQLWLLAVPMLIFVLITFFGHFILKLSDTACFISSVTGIVLIYILVWILNKKNYWSSDLAATIERDMDNVV